MHGRISLLCRWFFAAYASLYVGMSLNPITLLLACEINFLGSNAELKCPGFVETMGPMSPPVGRVKI